MKCWRMDIFLVSIWFCITFISLLYIVNYFFLAPAPRVYDDDDDDEYPVLGCGRGAFVAPKQSKCR